MKHALFPMRDIGTDPAKIRDAGAHVGDAAQVPRPQHRHGQVRGSAPGAG